MTPEQQAIENLIQMAGAFLESQAVLARNAVKTPQESLQGMQAAEPVIVEADENFA